jgi:hypothetical protein
MTGLAIAMPGLIGIEVTLPGEDWSFLIRRLDFSADHLFSSWHGREIHAREFARILPNWASMGWAQVPPNLLSRSESYGRDKVYQVNVKTRHGSAKQHADVVAAFLRFMANSTAAHGGA